VGEEASGQNYKNPAHPSESLKRIGSGLYWIKGKLSQIPF
jgi:hypothetical protein